MLEKDVDVQILRSVYRQGVIMTFTLHLGQLKVPALVLIHMYFQKLMLFHWRKFEINILYSPSQCYLVHF